MYDPYSQYHQKNNRRMWDRSRWEGEFGDRSKIPALPPSSSSAMSAYDTDNNTYGFLVDLINRLAAKEGFEAILKKIESGKLEAQV